MWSENKVDWRLSVSFSRVILTWLFFQIKDNVIWLQVQCQFSLKSVLSHWERIENEINNNEIWLRTQFLFMQCQIKYMTGDRSKLNDRNIEQKFRNYLKNYHAELSLKWKFGFLSYFYEKEFLRFIRGHDILTWFKYKKWRNNPASPISRRCMTRSMAGQIGQLRANL